MKQEMHYIYVFSTIENGVPVAPCKIGITSQLSKRLKSIQTGSPRKLEIISTVAIPHRPLVEAVEKYLHWWLSDYRLEGEWFNICPVDAAIGVCTAAHDAFLEIVPDASAAYDALENLGICAEIKACYDFIAHCETNGISIDSRFKKGPEVPRVLN